MAILNLVAGVHQFQSTYFQSHRDLFEHLSRGQNPDTLFITCSDSRIDPNRLTNTRPGDLFIIRNAGNLVPVYRRGAAHGGGEAPTIEFAVGGLGVTNVIICGHSHCGAMKGLLHPEYLLELPTVAAWLEHAEGTRRIMWDKYQTCTPQQLLDATTQENVLVQLENLQTHPCIADRLAKGKLKLHGWVYDIGTGEVHAYDPETKQFAPIGAAQPTEHQPHDRPDEQRFESV